MTYVTPISFDLEQETESAISELMNFFYTSLNNNDFTLGSFIDHSKAYDVIDQRILFRELEVYGIGGIP